MCCCPLLCVQEEQAEAADADLDLWAGIRIDALSIIAGVDGSCRGKRMTAAVHAALLGGAWTMLIEDTVSGRADNNVAKGAAVLGGLMLTVQRIKRFDQLVKSLMFFSDSSTFKAALKKVASLPPTYVPQSSLELVAMGELPVLCCGTSTHSRHG